MPLRIPETMNEEHEELHRDLARATKLRGHLGEAAGRVAKVLRPHFERENEIALPVIGVARELAEGKSSLDFAKALQFAETFRSEYPKMLQEHAEILKALDELEQSAKAAERFDVVRLARRLKLHARTEEDLTYPAVLIIEKYLNHVLLLPTSVG